MSSSQRKCQACLKTRSKLTHLIVLWRLRDAQRNCHKIIDLPSGIDLKTAKSKNNNGVFEITFGKKEKTKPNEKQIKITKKQHAGSINVE
jgi:hypothetical protein